MNINPDETLLRGSWNLVGGKVVADAMAQRIEDLIRRSLRKIGSDDSGWDTLYVDPDDGRLWELLYLESESYGGGPPTLRLISKEDAMKKYSHIYTRDMDDA